MSTGLESARYRAGHFPHHEVLERGIAAAVREVDEWRHRAVVAESALGLLSKAAMPDLSTPTLTDREVTDGLAHALAAADVGEAHPWTLYLPDARAAIDYLQSIGKLDRSTRVITGDIPTVTAALDALPVGSIITCDEEWRDVIIDPDGLLTYQRLTDKSWWQIGFTPPVDSENIARHEVPITVLREGVRG